MTPAMRKIFSLEHDIAFEVMRTHGQNPSRFVEELLKKPLTALTDAEYKKECAIFPKEALPEEIIKSDEELPDKLELLFPDGDRCCVAAIPFIEGGYSKRELTKGQWEEFLYHRRHITALRVFFKDITGGYGDVAARYYKILPPKLQADVSEGGCTFRIEYPFPGEVNDKRNRAGFAELYRKAYANLRNFLTD